MRHETQQPSQADTMQPSQADTIAATQAAAIFDLLDLPDDLLVKVARHALAMEVPAALRLLQTCKALQARLGAIGAEAEALKLCWVEEGMVEHTISEDGLTLTRTGCGPRMSWASGSLLPTVGRSTWAVRVEKSAGNNGGLHIGVCDATGRNAWSLYLYFGMLYRYNRDEHGRMMWATDEETGYQKLAPPPDGFPDGYKKQLLFDADGTPDNLRGRAIGARCTIRQRHTCGSTCAWHQRFFATSLTPWAWWSRSWSSSSSNRSGP